MRKTSMLVAGLLFLAGAVAANTPQSTARQVSALPASPTSTDYVVCDDFGVTWEFTVTGSSLVGFIDTQNVLGCGPLYIRGMFTAAGFDTIRFSVEALRGGPPPSCNPVIWVGIWDPAAGAGRGTYYSQNGTNSGLFQLFEGPCPRVPNIEGHPVLAATMVNQTPGVLHHSTSTSRALPTNMTLCDSFGITWQFTVTRSEAVGFQDYTAFGCGLVYFRGLITGNGFDDMRFSFGALQGSTVPPQCAPGIYEGTWDPASGAGAGLIYTNNGLSTVSYTLTKGPCGKRSSLGALPPALWSYPSSHQAPPGNQR